MKNNNVKTSEFIIEKANSEDFKLLTHIAKISKTSLGYTPEIIKVWETELAVSPEMIKNYISFVAKKNMKIVGFWCREPANGLSDGRLFVLPEEQRKGCGSQLWEAVISECKKRGLKYLEWETDFKVLPFYLKMGATHIRNKPSEYIPGLLLPIVGVKL